uniref:Sensory neuron membrane protein 1 n=1 Tax=Heortia vitessoides TaxID=1557813 RepID=A0A3G6VEY0_9NEOP|nr:sensory neuron membrane protein 1 [Heortia vitessoides]
MQLQKHMKIGLGTAGAGLFGILFGWVLFPALLKSQLKKEMSLSKKTDTRGLWEKVPFALNFKIYMFNYTNPAEIQKGAIPIVKEVGPYHFDEWKEKVEVEDHEEDDTITYKKKDAFYFRPDLSGPGLTGDELIITPHLLIIPVTTLVHRDKPAMLNMIGKAFNGLFNNPEDVFMRVKVMDLLFKGTMINCDHKDFAPKALCTGMKKESVSGLVLEANNQFRFSIFGGRNATVDTHVVTVKRGIQNVMDVGKVVAMDGKTEQDVWTGHCNQFEGTDGTIFPPFVSANEKIESFSGDLCRTFKLWYEKKSSYKGIKTNRYISNIGDLANNDELRCLCDAPDACPPKGFMDLYKCTKAPLYASLPHFLDCDPKYLKDIVGLNPDVNEHGIELDFEPISGTPLTAKQRVQFNIILLKTDKMELFKNLPGTMAPLFWIEESLVLPNSFIKMLKNMLFLPKRVVGVIRWVLVSIGVVGIIATCVKHYKERIVQYALSPASATVTKVNPEENNNNQPKDISVIGEPQPPPKVDM